MIREVTGLRAVLLAVVSKLIDINIGAESDELNINTPQGKHVGRSPKHKSGSLFWCFVTPRPFDGSRIDRDGWLLALEPKIGLKNNVAFDEDVFGLEVSANTPGNAAELGNAQSKIKHPIHQLIGFSIWERRINQVGGSEMKRGSLRI